MYLIMTFVKNTVYNKLVTNVNNIDTTGSALKTKYDTKTKITEIEGKIASISGLATNSALTAK